MQGTFINVISIIIGSLIGSLIGNKINENYSVSSIQCMGLVAISLGISWIAQSIPHSKDPLLFIITLVLGNLIGEVLQIDQRIEKFQEKYQVKNQSSNIIQGLTTTVLLFCLGTFSILGPIKARLNQEYTLLYTNALLDGISCIIFGATYGIRIAFSAVILFIWQGSIYLFAQYLEPYITTQTLIEINIIGGILILCTGLNILKITNIRTLNILPAIFLSLLYMIIFNN